MLNVQCSCQFLQNCKLEAGTIHSSQSKKSAVSSSMVNVLHMFGATVFSTWVQSCTMLCRARRVKVKGDLLRNGTIIHCNCCEFFHAIDTNVLQLQVVTYQVNAIDN